MPPRSEAASGTASAGFETASLGSQTCLSGTAPGAHQGAPGAHTFQGDAGAHTFLSSSGPTHTLCVLLSARAGDWSKALAALAPPPGSTVSGGTASGSGSAATGSAASGIATSCSAASGYFEVELDGPYPFGGGDWALAPETARGLRSHLRGRLGRGPRGRHPLGRGPHGEPPALLLLAGGTGVSGWLPGLAARRPGGRRPHLVWCVAAC